MIEVIVTCDYPDCGRTSEPVETYAIDTYDWHDAPTNAACFEPPTGWLHDTLYGFIACPDHHVEMFSDRQKWATR
jgi:hypothetical protein